jgi:hypothetical protein
MNQFENFPVVEPEPEEGNTEEKEESKDRNTIYKRLSLAAKRVFIIGMVGLGIGYGIKGIEESKEYNKFIESQGAVAGENFKRMGFLNSEVAKQQP